MLRAGRRGKPRRSPKRQIGFRIGSKYSGLAAGTVLLVLSVRVFAAPVGKPDGVTNQAAEVRTGGNELARDYYASRYQSYRPGFLPPQKPSTMNERQSDERSSEKNFDNLSVLAEDTRVDAAIGVAEKREHDAGFREAQPLYQDIIERMPDALFRVSENGVFVRAADYCQMRLLAMPPADLAFYRTQYDARAAEAFAEAERQSSLAGYQEIVDGMLATSWGDKAMLALGRAALDAGRYEDAYQRLQFIKTFFSGGHCDTPELAVLLAYAARKTGQTAPALSADNAALPKGVAQLKAALPGVTPVAGPIPPRSPACASGGDYGRAPVPPGTPLLGAPVWEVSLPAQWFEKEVYSSPVVTGDSVLIRHKNIVTCYSLLTGLQRWKNDMGGRVVWQNRGLLAFPNEELIVAGDMVYTVVYRGGPSLVALSLTTGEMRWAAGPMTAAGETHLRYEAAPVVDGGVVYAGYILDNIEGDTHFDTVYGVRAFNAETGQLLWDRPISRLPTGKFNTNVGDVRRVKIRSFASPPVLQEGVLYYNTNAGTLAALDSRTGRVKWVIRYPYYASPKAPIHDANEPSGSFLFSSGATDDGIDQHSALWRSQPPLVYKDCLYVAPVDSSELMAVELATGKVRWSHKKGVWNPQIWTGYSSLGPGYLLGPTRAGQLIVIYGSRYRTATVLNAATGKVDWDVPNVVPVETSPALTEPIQYRGGVLGRTMEINAAQFIVAARPTLFEDDTLFLSSFAYYVFGMGVNRAFVHGLATLSIPDQKVVRAERYYDPSVLASAETIIRSDAPGQVRFYEGEKADRLRKIMADRVPDNPVGSFKPATVVTAERFGTVFEIRLAADGLAVVYDKSRVEQFLKDGQTAGALQARAELALARSAYAEAAALLNVCLARIPPEQVAFREKIDGLFHTIDMHLARKNLLRGEYPDYVGNAGLLLRTSLTLPQEMQSLLAVAEGYERTGDAVRAARTLRNVIDTFGTREYAVSPLLFRQDTAGSVAALFDHLAGQTPV